MGASTLRLILGDQLTPSLSSLCDIDPETDVILMAEVDGEATYVRHHKKKIALIFSAMRHFAEEMAAKGFAVRYVKIDDPDNTHSIKGEVIRAVDDVNPAKVIVTEAGEWRLLEDMRSWPKMVGCDVEIREDDRFICSHETFMSWSRGRKTLRMEYFYREMRKQTGLLMEGDEPVGGEWNYDSDNRKALPKNYEPPKPYQPRPDDITREVLATVAERYGDHFGDLEPFHFAVTRREALEQLNRFVEGRLSDFGAYQDAMALGEDTLNHSLISASLNIGLLTPLEVCQKAEEAYRDGQAPLNSVEGFIRQIIGWREYIRGIYWLKMPDYLDANFLEAERPLPEFYWTGETDMTCLAEAVRNSKENAYAHHIQRLMVTGNFALLIGASPDAVNEWYMTVYADAFEWVEAPNTHGMAIFADGGVVASKPYAASGAYINRMSDYCKSCAYDVNAKSGENACPFNYLYWDFLIRNRDKFDQNHRMGMMYRNIDKMNAEKISAIKYDSAAFLKRIG